MNNKKTNPTQPHLTRLPKKEAPPATKVEDLNLTIGESFFDEKEVKVTTESTELSQTDIDAIVAAQLTDRKFAPITADELTKNVTYVTAGNGLFKVVKTAVALFTTKISDLTGKVPGLPDMTAGIELLIPKIPFKHILQALTFYIDINDQDKTEASTLFFWNHNQLALPAIPGVSQEGQLVTYCPVQKNSAALTEFGHDTHVNWFRQNMSLLLELHSH